MDVVSKSLNDVDVDVFYDEAVYMHDTTLPANLRFNTLAVNGSVETTYLSGHNISDYFRQSGRVFFDGDLTVDGDLTLAADATVAGLVDGFRMSPSALILRHGDQHINCKQSPVILQYCYVANLFFVATCRDIKW